MNRQITYLKTYLYWLSWHKRLFFPDKLKKMLKDPESSNFAIVESALNCSSFFLDKFTGLQIFFSSPTMQTCRKLYELNLFNESNFNAIQNHQYPVALNSIFHLLHKVGLLKKAMAQANFNTVIIHPNLEDINYLVLLLDNVGLLTTQVAQANFDAMVIHQNPKILAGILNQLLATGLLDISAGGQANFNAVVTHESPCAIVRLLEQLNEAHLLINPEAQANRDAVVTNQNPWTVSKILRQLSNAGLFNTVEAQANFNRVIKYVSIIDFDEEIKNCWYKIPSRLLTQPRWNDMVDICKQNQPDKLAARLAWIDYINQILKLPKSPYIEQRTYTPKVRSFNGEQSTHTASVHQSVSESSTRLLNRYKIQLRGTNLNKHITALTNWVGGLPDGNQTNNAAKRCLPRLVAPGYVFTDPGSGINLRQLLALTWLALHDEQVRMGDIADAEKLLLEGLYDIQRGYNLSETGVDLGGPDKVICPAGTFNKLLEKLQGIHPDVIIVFITKETAALKLPIIIKEEIEQNLALGVGVRDAIKEKVTTRIFDEFGSLYKNNNDLRFTNFVETALEAQLSSAVNSSH